MTTEWIDPSLKRALASHYHLERLVGRGGMATVYLAWDLKHGRPVAIKVLRPELEETGGPTAGNHLRANPGDTSRA